VAGKLAPPIGSRSTSYATRSRAGPRSPSRSLGPLARAGREQPLLVASRDLVGPATHPSSRGTVLRRLGRLAPALGGQGLCPGPSANRGFPRCPACSASGGKRYRARLPSQTETHHDRAQAFVPLA